MAKDRNGIDLWRQVSETLAGDIANGVLTAGERLPASSKLAARFGVHQHTVLKAIAYLQDEGIVRIEHGRGTFVVDRPVQIQLGKRTWFEQNLRDLQHSPTRTLLSVTEMRAEEAVAEALKLTPRDKVVQTVLLGEADEVPIYFGRQYFPVRRFPGILDVFTAFGFERTDRIVFSRLFKTYGYAELRRHTVRIRGRLPTGDEARHLRAGRNTPLIETRITLVDPADEPVFFSLAAYCADRVELTVDL